MIDKHGIELASVTDCLLIRQPEETVRTLPLSRVSKLLCMHNVQLSTQLLGQLYKRGIDFVVLNNRYAENSFALFADLHQSALRRCHQYAWQLDANARFHLAKAICQHKLQTSKRVVATEKLHRISAQLLMASESLQNCKNEEQLRGIEGSAQKALFNYWRLQLDPAWRFEKRIRRPPPDPVNALLSFAYTLVHQEAVRQCKKYGLDPDLGFYHRLAYSRHSLACDLMEPVRPKVEQWIISTLARGNINRKHFSKPSANGCFLGKQGRLIFYPLFDQQLPLYRRMLAANAHWLVNQFKQSNFSVEAV